jgi:hypothetical protein
MPVISVQQLIFRHQSISTTCVTSCVALPACCHCHLCSRVPACPVQLLQLVLRLPACLPAGYHGDFLYRDMVNTYDPWVHKKYTTLGR